MPACRFCNSRLSTVFADLGMSPLSNAYVPPEALSNAERFYPLKVFACDQCFLVQLPAAATPAEIFSDYAYFSSFSSTWLAHCEQYAAMITERLRLGSESRVVEIASNDGYLLQYFTRAAIPVLGIEPAANVAEAAVSKGVPTIVRFFGKQTAQEIVSTEGPADLLIANNVLAHVPDLNDFVEGCCIALAAEGVLTVEVPHLLQLVQQTQFDTIYHEHFSYFSLRTAMSLFAAHDLAVFDVEELPTHGGSIRMYVAHARASHMRTEVVDRVLRDEERARLYDAAMYEAFFARVKRVKRDLLSFLIAAKNQNEQVVAYGAPAKGNTLLNYCGIREDMIDYTVDRSPHKQGFCLPGTHIPILSPDRIFDTRPAYLVILPWNLRDEIVEQMKAVRTWGCRFVVPIPALEVIP